MQVIAQLGWPDMRLPILYAMSWPHRIHVDYGRGIDNKFDLVRTARMRTAGARHCRLADRAPHFAILTAPPPGLARCVQRRCTCAQVKLGSMTFKAPDYAKYPCIPLAFAAGRKGGTMTCALNAANERANELFRAGKFDFFGIPKVRRADRLPRCLPVSPRARASRRRPRARHGARAARRGQVIEKVMGAHEKDWLAKPELEDILRIDAWAREQVDVEAAKLASAKVLIH